MAKRNQKYNKRLGSPRLAAQGANPAVPAADFGLTSRAFIALWQRPRALWISIKAWWGKQRAFHKHWIINVLLGLAIESVLIVGHIYHWGVITQFTNTGLDVMTRLSQSACSVAHAVRAPGGVGGSIDQQHPPNWVEQQLRCPSAEPAANLPLLVDVDERTWRSAQWGGGEPAMAPRDELATLVEQAFELGATRVVLDVLVQDRTTVLTDTAVKTTQTVDTAGSSPADMAFAKRMSELLNKPYFEPDKLLTLVRTERTALLDDVNRGGGYINAFLPSTRVSAALDSVVKQSNGRIALAAPYFLADGQDHVTRDWVLFKVHCNADPTSAAGGRLQIVPSVQLLVAAHAAGVSPLLIASPSPTNGSQADCTPFPTNAEPTDLAKPAALLAQELKTQLYGNPNTPQAGLVGAYWERVRDAFNQQARAGHKLEGLPAPESLGNRIVYRYRYSAGLAPGQAVTDPLSHAGFVHRLPAGQLLAAADLRDARLSAGLRTVLEGRTVVIGQTFKEAGDMFYTPLGTMPGAAVLVNAIDSMRVHQLLRTTGGGVSITIALILIVLVGYLFARWDSTRGTILSTLAVLLSVGVASFFMFQHGIWLDVVAPILGIQLHRLWAAWEERHELKQRRHAAGDGHH